MALNRYDIFFRNFRNWKHYLRYENHVSKHNFSTFTASKAPEKVHNVERPIKYSTTQSSKKTYNEIFGLKSNPAVLDIEKYVIAISLLCFFTYFILLRRKNKYDDILGGKHNTSDEEIKLLNALLYAKFKGLKTDEIEHKLQLIKQTK